MNRAEYEIIQKTSGYQELPSPPEEKFPGNDAAVPGRTPGATAQWRVVGSTLVLTCTCGTVTQVPVTALTRFPVKAGCCKNAPAFTN